MPNNNLFFSFFFSIFFVMPSSKRASGSSQKDLHSLKKNELIRLIVDLRNSVATSSEAPDKSDSVVGIPAHKAPPQQSPSDKIHSSSVCSCRESSILMDQVRSAVTDAVRDLKSELRLEYQSALTDQELKFSREVLTLRDEINLLKNKIDQACQDIEAEFFRDLRDAEHRKKNLIFFGVDECVSSVSTERKDADFRAIKLMASELGVKDLHFQNAFRLGKLRDKPRPIKLIGLSHQQREDLLKLSFRIPRLNPALGFRKVFIKADLSLKEQALERELRREVDARRQAGENVFLRGGKILLRAGDPDASRSHPSGLQTD